MSVIVFKLSFLHLNYMFGIQLIILECSCIQIFSYRFQSKFITYATVLFVELDQGHADLLMKAPQDQYHPAWHNQQRRSVKRLV